MQVDDREWSDDQTRIHIGEVRNRMLMFIQQLAERARLHDQSKLEEEEASAFAKVTPKLRTTTYGSDEYKALLREIRPAVELHYKFNSHHPEFYEKGVLDFDLFDLIEMFCDWKAATMRHADGNLKASIEHNRERFKMDDLVTSIFRNTAKRLGW